MQDALSSNPIGCRKIKGDNSSAAGCGLDTAQLTQPAFTTDPIRNASLTLTKDFVVDPPDALLSPKRRQLLSTGVSAEPFASVTTVQGEPHWGNSSKRKSCIDNSPCELACLLSCPTLCYQTCMLHQQRQSVPSVGGAGR